MKTTMITLAAIFTLFANVLVAGNDYNHTIPPVVPAITLAYFAPTTPAVATFEDAIMTPDISGLYPVIPSEASFEETVTDNVSVKDLAPAIPSEADFE